MRELRSKLKATTIIGLIVGAFLIVPNSALAQFGITSFTTTTSTAQAGAHPDFSSGFALDSDALGNPVGQIENATVTLPPGVVGNPQAIEQCSTRTFEQLNCPAASQIGILEASFVICRGVTTPLESTAEAGATVLTVENTSGMCAFEPDNTITIGTGESAEQVQIAYVTGPTTLELTAPIEHTHLAGESVTHIGEAVSAPLPLFNLQPSPGHTATFGTSVLFVNILVQVDVRADGRVVVTLNGLSTFLPIRAATMTLWGVPADPSHDALHCDPLGGACGASGGPPKPFITNPTDCSGAPLESDLTLQSWQGQSATSSSTLAPREGCEHLKMSPSLTVVPDTTRRDTPAGYEVDLKAPQDEEAYGLSTADLQNVSVTLPKGTSLSPAMANGLEGCTDAQFNGTSAEGCPNASKVGTAEVTSPVLPSHLTGAIYIGTPTPTEKYRLFVTVSTGNATVNLVGRAEPDEATGQVTAVFTNVPQLPFSDLKLVFFGGPAAALANPAQCGPATSTSQIASYGGQTANPSSTFTVGASSEEVCPSRLPFAPTFTAGTTSPIAGGFSPFSMTVSRGDGERALASLTAQLPPGLLAMLSRVPLCGEPQAATGTCSPLSQIGSTTIAAGAGSQPLYLSGPVYLTGPYKGAPFGLSIAVPAIAGPLNLGTIVVRAQVLLNTRDVRMTIASDPFPQILDGIPLRLRTVNLAIGRPNFIFNPSSCAAQSVSGSVGSVDGDSTTVFSPFQIAGCGALSFSPKLTASAQAAARSQGNGASLDVRVATPAGAQANIKSVVADLPGRLRPRLTTIRQACPATVFVVNPTACPRGARVGTATVSTPVLSSPLNGSIYLVVRGGSAYPEFTMVLQGQGVKVELSGTISITSGDIVRATFKALPDVPIRSFDLQLNRGPDSILGATESLCSGKLEMPYTITAQNGAHFARVLRVSVGGCRKRGLKKGPTARPRHGLAR